MLLLVNPSLWQLGSCLVSVAVAQYVFSHWVINLGLIYTQLKRIVALPTLTHRESTWPGEADWLSDDEDAPKPTAVIESTTKRVSRSVPATVECLSPVAPVLTN